MRKTILSLFSENYETFNDSLSSLGFHVVEHPNSDLALQALGQYAGEVALIVIHTLRTREHICDYASKLKAVAPNVPIVVQTADPRYDLDRTLKIPGVDVIYSKLDGYRAFIELAARLAHESLEKPRSG